MGYRDGDGDGEEYQAHLIHPRWPRSVRHHLPRKMARAKPWPSLDQASPKARAKPAPSLLPPASKIRHPLIRRI